MELRLKYHKNFVIASFLFFIVFTIYLFTLAPTIYIEDSSEYITAAYTLSIPHPSGYPLYVLLGKIFTYIPLGSIAWRVNLMSAFFGALTVSLVYVLIKTLTKNTFISLVCALILGVSETFWSQSLIAEVYTFNSFFVALTLWLLIFWTKSRENKALLWFAFVYGLSLTNHEMMGLLGPVFLLYILMVDKQIWRDWRLILRMFLLFLLGLTVYLYLPLRSLQNPPLDWGNPETLKSFWGHIARKFYGDFSPTTQSFGKIGLIISFFVEIAKQFYWPSLLLAFFGSLFLLIKNRKLAFLTIGVFLANSFGIFFLRKTGWGLGIEYINRVYYLPCFIIVVLWLAIILRYLYQQVSRLFLKHGKPCLVKMVIGFGALVFLAVPWGLFQKNYQINGQRDFWLNYDYYQCLLKSLPPNAVLALKNEGLASDTEIFTLIYFRMIEKFRPDIFIVDDLGIFYKKIVIDFPKEYYGLKFGEQQEKLVEIFWNFSQKFNFPLYTNFPVYRDLGKLGLISRSNGLVYKVYSGLEEARKDKDNFFACSLRNFGDKKLEDSYGMADFLAHIYYKQAGFYLAKGDKETSHQLLIKAVNLDNELFSNEYQNFIKYRNDWLGE